MTRRTSVVVVTAAVDRLPGIPRDLEDHGRDRETDQRVCQADSECNHRRAGYDSERDERVDSGVIPVRDQGLPRRQIGRDPRQPDRRILAMTKSNIGPTAPALACRLAEEAGRPRLQWLGECDATADELCRPPSPGTAPDRATADEWLLAALAGGPRPAKELQEEARAAGYCVRTLERAKRRLGVVARRVHKDGRAFWQWSNSTLPHGAGRRR